MHVQVCLRLSRVGACDYASARVHAGTRTCALCWRMLLYLHLKHRVLTRVCAWARGQRGARAAGTRRACRGCIRTGSRQWPSSAVNVFCCKYIVCPSLQKYWTSDQSRWPMAAAAQPFPPVSKFNLCTLDCQTTLDGHGGAIRVVPGSGKLFCGCYEPEKRVYRFLMIALLQS